MSYLDDAKTLALYDLDDGGDNIAGNADWDVVAVGDGTFAAPANFTTWSTWAGGFTVEREVRLAVDAPGTILELGGWGETEAVNIQCVVGWGADRKLFVGWERGGGIDYVLTSTAALPLDTDLRIAVTFAGAVNGGRTWIAVNGEVVASARLPYPTGGDDGVGPTPGLTFAIGRRVSTADPVAYTGGGWLRISEPRTIDEVIADWDSSLSPAVPSGLSWEDLAKRDGSFRYVVFRGRFRASDTSPGEVVAWSTHDVHAPDGGLLRRRLAAPPAAIVRGVPESLGAMPERVSTSLMIDNKDGAIDTWLAGGDDPRNAHAGDSLLNLSGHLFEGRIGPDGVAVEHRITPRLVASDGAAIDSATRTVEIQMATDDEGILGPPRAFFTVAQLRSAGWSEAGPIRPINMTRDVAIVAGLVDPNLWDLIRSRMTDNLDQTIPWGYGISPIPMVYVGGPYFLAAVSLHEPRDLAAWRLYGEDWRRRMSSGGTIRIFSVRVTVSTGDVPIDVWVVGVEFRSGPDEPGAYHLIPSAAAGIGIPPGSRATPSRILRQIVSDLGSDGGSSIDTVSFGRLERELRHTGIGGTIGNGSMIAEIASHICDPYGISAWVGPDDRLHAARMTGWGLDDVVAAAGDLPHIMEPDVLLGTVTYRQPTSAELGGASTRTSIEWTSEQDRFWEGRPLLDRAPGIARITLEGDAEARISGAWVFPTEAERALSSVGSRRAFSYAHVTADVGAWILAYDLGQMFRFTHRFLGYDRRLVRLIRIEYQPGDDTARCAFLDIGALELLTIGKLDSAQNWIFYDPGESVTTITFAASNNILSCNDPSISEDWVGRSLWTFGASDPALRRSWRIESVNTGSGLIGVDPTPTVSGTAEADGLSAHRAGWIVMRNRSSDPTHRPEYITVADAATGEHTDESSAYRFSS